MTADYSALLVGVVCRPLIETSPRNMHTRIAMERTANTPHKETDAKPAWYCLRAQPKHEHIAAAHLRILEGVTAFCPRIRFRRVTRQGTVWVTEAMFPGYLFARFELLEMHRQVQYAHGVSGIVRFADQY